MVKSKRHIYMSKRIRAEKRALLHAKKLIDMVHEHCTTNDGLLFSADEKLNELFMRIN